MVKNPVWTADYVLISYGTGAIMAVLPMMNGIMNLPKSLESK